MAEHILAKTEGVIKHDDGDIPNGGVLAKLSKTSWVWMILIGFGSAGIGSYYAVKQDLTVMGATLQLQITSMTSRLDVVETKVNKDIVPRQEHDVRIQLQKQIDDLRDELAKTRAYTNAKNIEELREDMRDLKKVPR